MSFWFILAIVVAIITLLVAVWGFTVKVPAKPVLDAVDDESNSYDARFLREENRKRQKRWETESEAARGRRLWGWLALIGGGGLVAVLVFASTLYRQDVGQGVIITRAGGAIVKADATSGYGFKAPWDSVHKWDLFTRDISLSEPSEDFENEFERGEITASRVATAVASGEDSGAQVWFDLEATYNLVDVEEEPEVIEQRLLKLFKTYRSQDRFTRQLIYPALLKSANTVPSGYTTVQFRGAGSVKAAQTIGSEVTSELSDAGVTISTATIKDVEFTAKVEESISKVEEKQQLAEEAKADAAAQDVKNEQIKKDAEAQAEANKTISNSLTPELLELRKIEGYKKGDVFYVPEGSSPLLSNQR